MVFAATEGILTRASSQHLVASKFTTEVSHAPSSTAVMVSGIAICPSSLLTNCSMVLNEFVMPKQMLRRGNKKSKQKLQSISP